MASSSSRRPLPVDVAGDAHVAIGPALEQRDALPLVADERPEVGMDRPSAQDESASRLLGLPLSPGMKDTTRSAQRSWGRMYAAESGSRRSSSASTWSVV